MRPRRRMQPPIAGFALPLPSDSDLGEVQVRPQNAQDRFLIETDDNMISPLITANACFNGGHTHLCGGTVVGGCGGGGNTSRSGSSKNVSAAAAAMAKRSAALTASINGSSGVTTNASPATMTCSLGACITPAAPPTPRSATSAPNTTGGAGGSAGAAAKFIHLNNTNLFVLMDGVSMFFEGKSTFTGHDDPLLLQQVKSKRKTRKGGTGAPGRHASSTTARATNGGGSGEADGSGTVEDVIRTIEQNDATSTSTPEDGEGQTGQAACTRPCVGATAAARTRATSASSGHSSASVGGVTGRGVSIAHVPSAFAALFANAKKPSMAPLFKHQTAVAPLSVAGAKLEPATVAQDGKLAEKSSSGDAGSSTAVVAEAAVTTGSVSSRAASDVGGRRRGGHERQRPLSVKDIGHSNRSLDLDDVEVLNYIGGGSQGKVYRVRLDGKLYALKCMDLMEAIEATNAVERQGRKRGLVKELNMICLQRARPPPQHLMLMFNAVVSLVSERKQLSVLNELMSFSVEDAQKMVARIPQNELMKIAQSVFGDYLSKGGGGSDLYCRGAGGDGNASSGSGSTGGAVLQMKESRRLKHELGSCMHLIGRSAFDVPEEWEKKVDRQTALPEIVLSMMAADVLRGLKELHDDYHMVHCDLKPDNVLLCFDKLKFKLADFGCGCAMDPVTGRVRHTGVDLGSKLYKAPERLSNTLPLASSATTAPSSPVTVAGQERINSTDGKKDSGGEIDVKGCVVNTSSSGGAGTGDGVSELVEFSAKADVWSLGIMLLELSCGVHPCSPFKSDYWNYTNLLRLPKMVKPLTWSFALFDFIVRCVRTDVATRWSVDELLQHPFIRRYNDVHRSKLKRFMERLEGESATFQRKQQMALLQKQILLSTAKQAKDNYQKQSRNKWKVFTGFLKEAPEFNDTTKFPPLQP